MNDEFPPPITAPAINDDNSGQNAPDRRVRLIVGAAAIVILVILGGRLLTRDDMNDTLEKIIAPELELNFADQGVQVDITRIDCEDAPSTDGDFTVGCTVTLEGVAETITATAIGNISGSRVSVTSTTSEARLLNAQLAVSYVWQIVTSQDPSVMVTSCELGAKIIVVTVGDTFSCTLSTGQVATLTVNQNGSASITNVQ